MCMNMYICIHMSIHMYLSDCVDLDWFGIVGPPSACKPDVLAQATGDGCGRGPWSPGTYGTALFGFGEYSLDIGTAREGQVVT